MSAYTSDIAFTEAVKKVQQSKGSRGVYARMETGKGWQQDMPDAVQDFIRARDHFYLGTATADGQPYIQHRGGDVGFLKIIDNRTLAFADFTGNRQYITTGNLSENNKAYIFLIDYTNRRRIKLWGTARVETDTKSIAALVDSDYHGSPESAMYFDVLAWDINCPQHITERYDKQTVVEMIEPLQRRIDDLQNQIKQLTSNSR